jgi:hypothetical protein
MKLLNLLPNTDVAKLRPGLQVPIYLGFKNKERYEGIAMLIRYESDGLSFFVDDDPPKGYHPAIYKYERWLVEFDYGMGFTFRTHRKIRRLVVPEIKIRKNSRHISKYTTYDYYDEREQEDLED